MLYCHALAAGADRKIDIVLLVHFIFLGIFLDMSCRNVRRREGVAMNELGETLQ